jgi:uncharacterized membrane protein
VTESIVFRAVHVLAAMTWIGGMFFVALVFVPVARRLDDPALRVRLFHLLGLRFRTVGWIALGLLVATGLANLWMRPYLLATTRFQVKLALVIVAVALSITHDFWIGPRAGQPGADPALRVRASWLARVNVLVVIVITVLGVALRG